jgi:hypothetical protein
MLIEVQRVWESSQSVCGMLSVDGLFQCYTLEPSRLNPFYAGHPCIPAGTYPVVLTLSPDLGYVTPLLGDVSGRTYIRIHIGNFPRDVKGCTAVGQTHGTDYVGNSRLAFEALMRLLNTATDGIQATYVDPQ